MIEAREVLTGKINSKKGILVGKVNIGIKEIYPPLVDLEATPTKEVQEFNHENEYGYDKVKVNPIPDEYIIPNGELDINANGEVDVTSFKMARVGVYTPPKLQDKSIEITENGTTNITADEGFDGLSKVEITTNAIEDLEEELTTYNDELTEQETSIQDIIKTLSTKGKIEENYSIEEVKTSRTWVDGKPIYRKVFTGTMPTISSSSSNTIHSIDISNLNFENFVDLYGIINQSNGYAYWPLNFFILSGTTNLMASTYVGNGSKIQIRTNCTWLSSSTFICILEYTKTTD